MFSVRRKPTWSLIRIRQTGGERFLQSDECRPDMPCTSMCYGGVRVLRRSKVSDAFLSTLLLW
ncbi:hypothetical protein V3C99_016962 [Haemonchus contortus]